MVECKQSQNGVKMSILRSDTAQLFQGQAWLTNGAERVSQFLPLISCLQVTHLYITLIML